jgi:hypothetical protein
MHVCTYLETEEDLHAHATRHCEIVGARSTGDTSYNHHQPLCDALLLTKYLGRGVTTNLEWGRCITNHVEGVTVIGTTLI